ncbi:alpha/beta fold hydrolase [Streptomyces sp. NBC_00963]|uniref:alpha/beta fold hydrolase n=1 Tax=unclassified Streptomyces TaxID=2593676 RepID=UPI0022510C66|nr:alpha/beta fold hydrolase [Streptomyces sp. NBC_01306]MCX4724401.1 alpha/beta fold hydrolase [Streptomyces sp. NBC_01306]WSX44200.1 alpha/beta fold hydrolase [Streptomyces sp. NBC_00963]
MKVLPDFLSPQWLLHQLQISSVPLRATALDLAILAGHVLLYPSGIADERRIDLPLSAPPGGPAGVRSDDGPTSTGQPTEHTSTKRSGPTVGETPDTPLRNPHGRSLGHPRAGESTVEHLPPPGQGHRPVVLLHGFVDNRSVFVLLRRSLLRHGWQHPESLNYSLLTCDIRAAAELLGQHIEEICARTGHQDVDIVGHSLGGLIGRYYVQRLGGDRRVHTLVTLGTPHEGTQIAQLMSAHPLVRQMLPHSDVIEELRRPAPGCRTRFVSFWSELDHLMIPVEAGCIDHPDLITTNVRVSGIGHLALPVHPVVAAAIREALDASDETAAGSVESVISVA